MEAAIALGGQAVGRIESVRPVGQIIEDTVRGFRMTIGSLARAHVSSNGRASKCLVAMGARLGQDLRP